MATGMYPTDSSYPYPYPPGLNFTRRVTRTRTRVRKYFHTRTRRVFHTRRVTSTRKHTRQVGELELELQLQARCEAASLRPAPRACTWGFGAPEFGRGGAEGAPELGEERGDRPQAEAATRDARRGAQAEGASQSRLAVAGVAAAGN